MNEKELKQFNSAQVEEIKKFLHAKNLNKNKKINANQAAIEWIFQFSQEFRESYPIK